MGSPTWKERSRREGWLLRGRLVGLCWASSRGLTVALAGLLALTLAIPIASALALASVIDAASAPEAHLTPRLCLLGAVLAVQQVAGQALGITADRVGLGVRGAVYHRTAAALLAPASIAHLEDPDMADIVARASAGGRFGPRSAVMGLANVAASRLSGVGRIVVVWGLAWWSGPLLLVALVAFMMVTRRKVIEIATTQQQQTRTLRRSDYLLGLLLNARAAKEVRVFGLGPWLVDRMRDDWTTAMSSVRTTRRGILPATAIGAAPLIGAIAVICWAAQQQVVGGHLAVGSAIAIVSAAASSTTMTSVTAWDNSLELGLTGVASLRELEAAMTAPERAMPGTLSADGMPSRGLRVDGISFTYPGADRPVFSDLTLDVPAGHSLAIVGVNGVGKTTLMKLLLRLYDPDGGSISADGIDLRDLDVASWRSRVAVVFQDFLHYPGTARRNVALAGEADDAELLRAATLAGISERIERLPDGWDTLLDRTLGGAELSGGEWQRLALARALLVAGRGAEVLILDEPTAQLDVRQEAAFYERFLELTEGRTTIVISHRFSTVRRAHRIAVIEEGMVVEQGSHDELVTAGGRYAEMFALQADRFREADRA